MEDNNREALLSEKSVICLVFLSALTVRLCYLFQIKDNPAFYNLILDCLAYDKWAMNIASGNWLRDQVFYQDPLYPYFLALIYKLFGHDLLLTRIIQTVIGSVNCVLIYFICREVYGKKVALVGGFISAFYGIFIFYDGMINKPFLGVFFINLALLAFIVGIRKKNKGLFFISGGCLGLSMLARANILLMLPLFLIWICINSAGKKKFWYCGSFLLGVALLTFPATFHNYKVSGSFVLTTSQMGQNFYIGNHRNNDTGTYLPPLFLRATPEFEEDDFKSRAEFLSGKKLSPSEVSSFWVHETLSIIKSDSGRFIKNLWLKTRLFLNKFEAPDNHSYSFFKTYYSGILKWNPLDFRLIGSLGLAGLLLSFFWKSENHFAKFLPLFFLLYLGSIIPFYIFSRYRLPILSILIALSSFFIIYLMERIKSASYKEVAFAVCTFVLAFFFVNCDIKKDSFSNQFGNIAYSLVQQGDPEGGLVNYKKAVEIDPGYAEPYYFIGHIYAGMGELRQAEEYFKKSVGIEPKLFAGYSGLGIVSAKLGKMAEAESYLQRAVKLKPYAPEAHNNIGLIYAAKGKFELARAEFKEALSLDPNFVKASQNLERIKEK